MEVNSTGDLQAAASDNAENNIANTEEEIKANGMWIQLILGVKLIYLWLGHSLSII